jgi:hypothetical protein
MSFWDFQDGDEAVTGTFEVGGGNMEPIPNDTTCVAIVDEAKWDKDQAGNRLISLRWSVLAPDDYKNRKVFHKLWVQDDKPEHKDPAKKRDKDKRLLAAIDFNAGGKLMASGKAPTDDALGMALMNKPMSIKVMLWEIDGKTGNWISAVGPRGGKSATPTPAPKPVPIRTVVEDDDAPF